MSDKEDDNKRVKDFSQWIKAIKNNKPQFVIVSLESGTSKITCVQRIKDGHLFDLNKKYAAVRYSHFIITEFSHDLQGIQFEYWNGDFMYGAGIVHIDDIIIVDGAKMTDRMTENLIKNLTQEGIEMVFEK